jgi:hypothetical protein
MRTNRVVAAVCIALLSTAWSITATQAATKSPLSMQVDLDVTTIAAGHSIRGTAIITNASSTVIHVQTWECEQWIYVGLANKKVPFDPVVPLSACSASTTLKPGANRFPITLSTRYQSCEVGGTPRCTKSGMPSLPLGTYHVAVMIDCTPGVTFNARHVRVTLT